MDRFGKCMLILGILVGARTPVQGQVPGMPGMPILVESWPTAFDNEAPPFLGPRGTLKFEYLFLWFQGPNLPPLITTGSDTDTVPGALGQPNTQILHGGSRENFGLTNAFRASGSLWVADPEILAFEANFFIAEQRSRIASFAGDETGNPVITRPFFNPVALTEDAQPLSLPLALVGEAGDRLQTNIMGAEGNFKWNLNSARDDFQYFLLVGPRWFQLAEKFQTFDRSSNLPAGAGFTTFFQDNFTAYNQWFGGQIGPQISYRGGPLTFNAWGKIGVGVNQQTLRISGETTLIDDTTGDVFSFNDEGFYAQPSNIGLYKRNRLTFLPEVGTNLTFQFTENLRLNVGYTIFWLNQVIRAGEQVDRTINYQALGTGGATPPFLPGPPTFRQTSMYIQMLNLGLELVF